MARTQAQVQAARDALTSSRQQQAIDSLPPAYIAGFELNISSNQVKISNGIAHIRGKKVSTNADYILNWSDSVGSPVPVRNYTYYVYLNNSMNWKIDLQPPVYDISAFTFYHPQLSGFRWIQSFFLDSDGNYLSSETVMAYNGTGSNEAPHGGDWRVIMFEGSVKTQEYTSGTWVDKIVFGVRVAGLLLAMAGCTGIFHPANPPSNTEIIPNTSFEVYDFENDYQNQAGVDPWTTKTSLVFSTTYYKYGVYGISSAGVGVLAQTSYCTIGESQVLAFWFYVQAYPGVGQEIVHIKNGGSDMITFLLSTDGILRVTMYKGGGGGQAIVDNRALNKAGWHFAACIYNKTTELFTLVVDDRKQSITTTGTWTAGSPTATLTFNFLAGYFPAYDDLLRGANQYIDPDIIVQHFNHGTPWVADGRTAMDETYSAGPGGRHHFIEKIVADDDVEISGTLSAPKLDNHIADSSNPHGATLTQTNIEVANLKITASGSPFYDPLGHGGLGIPHPYSVSTGDINPADTNVHEIATFAALPAYSWGFFHLHFTGTAALRTLRLWWDSGGTVPAPGTGVDGTIALTFFYGTILIQLNSEGKLYYQVDNADVSKVNLTSSFYFV